MKHRIPILSTTCLVLLGLISMNMVQDEAQRIEFSLPSLAEIDQIKIERTGQKPVVLHIETGGTIRVGTQRTAIDDVAGKGLREAFAEPLGMDHTIDSKLIGDTYGVSEHSITISLNKGEARLAKFRLGKVIDGQRTFIEDLITGGVYRAKFNLRQVFDRPSFYWRERRMFPAHSYQDIQSLEMVGSDALSWRVTRSTPKSEWNPVLPKNIVLGQSEVDAVVNTFSSAHAIAEADESSFSPTRTYRARTFSGQTLTLELGPEAQDGSILARMKDGAVVTLPRHQKIFLVVNRDSLRNRRLFRSRPQELKEVKLAGRDAMMLTFDEGWQIVAPPPTARVRREVSDSFLEAITSIQGTGFGTENAFGDVDFSIQLRRTDDSVEILEIGERFGSGRYARNTKDRSRVLILPASAIDLLKLKRSALLVEQHQRER